jgi:lipoprotein-anchoring transpeptidase ErfK/SrfK
VPSRMRNRTLRPMFRARLKVLAAMVVVTAGAAGVASAPSASARKAQVVQPTQELAMLLTPHRVVASPDRRTKVAAVQALRPITGVRTVLPVVGHATTTDGINWLRVMVPGRPNGRKAWIAEQGTAPRETGWHLVVRTSRRRVLAYFHGSLVRSFRAIVGKPSTPTPHGQFFVEERMRVFAGKPGGPFALALSARSDVLRRFEGGPGQIALHGIANLGGTLGTAVSHGCVRLGNRSIRWLAKRISAGVPVTITG